MAEHKIETDVDTTLASERVKSVAAIVAALYFVANTILGSFGVNPLPFTNDEVAAAVSSVGAVVMTLIVWWRQNVITKAANEGHQLTMSIKQGQVETTQGTSPMPDDIDPLPIDTVADIEPDTETGE